MLGYQSVLYDDIDEWVDEEMLLLGRTAVRDGVGKGRRGSFKEGSANGWL